MAAVEARRQPERHRAPMGLLPTLKGDGFGNAIITDRMRAVVSNELMDLLSDHADIIEQTKLGRKDFQRPEFQTETHRSGRQGQSPG